MGSAGPRESRYDAWSLLGDDVVEDEECIATDDGANAATDEAEAAAIRADTSFMLCRRFLDSPMGAVATSNFSNIREYLEVSGRRAVYQPNTRAFNSRAKMEMIITFAGWGLGGDFPPKNSLPPKLHAMPIAAEQQHRLQLVGLATRRSVLMRPFL